MKLAIAKTLFSIALIIGSISKPAVAIEYNLKLCNKYAPIKVQTLEKDQFYFLCKQDRTGTMIVRKDGMLYELKIVDNKFKFVIFTIVGERLREETRPRTDREQVVYLNLKEVLEEKFKP